MKKYLLTLAAIVVSLTAMADDVPAFPGAEGHGRYTTGGRAKTVVHVTNLNDSGTGSFRSAVSSSNRTIVFDVAGVIALKSDLTIKDNITILGQTAPSPGITIRYYTVRPGANNIIRFVRFRRGSEKDTNDGADAMWQRQKNNLMIDHCSFSWSIDEVASFYDNNNFTMQWCTLGESLNNAGHGKGAHGYGGIWGGKLASFHHNMILHVNNRSPRFCGARYDWTGYTANKYYSEYKWANAVQAENVDLRNCVVYNANGCYGGPGGGQINMVGNYFKSGPAATINRLTTVSYGDSGNSADNSKYWGMTSRYYLEGNLIDDKNAGWDKMSYDTSVPAVGGVYYTYDEKHYYGAESYTQVQGKDALPVELSAPAPTGEVTTHTAAKAFEKIQSYGGSSLYRDDVDERYMREAKNGTAEYKGSVTGKAGRIDLVSDVNGYTEENFPTGSHPTGFDTDQDGIADAWETANGLNPNDASDAMTYTLDEKGWYTNLEVYANSLVQDIMIAGNKDAEQSVKEYYPRYTKEDGTVVAAINNGKEFDGNITWAYNDGTVNATPSYSADFAGAFTTTVATGANLTSAGTISTNNDLTLTAFACNDKDAEASDANAVRFSITPTKGNSFQPTSVSFKVSRNKEASSSVGGSFSAYWISSDGTQKVIKETTVAERCNRQPYVTEVTAAVNDGVPSAGTCTLVIHLFNFASNMPMGITDVAVNGIVSKSEQTAISTQKAAAEVIATEYYSLDGRKLTEPQRGINIRVEHLSNGQKVTTKVVR